MFFKKAINSAIFAYYYYFFFFFNMEYLEDTFLERYFYLNSLSFPLIPFLLTVQDV